MQPLSHLSFFAPVVRSTPLLLPLTFASLACGAGEAAPVDVDDDTDPSGVVFPSLVGDEAPAAPTGGDTAAAAVRPSDFTAAEVGGYKLGDAVSAGAPEAAEANDDGRTDGCGSILTGILRDIQESHPDFGGDVTNLQRGLVQDALGADGKPQLSQNFRRGFIESADSFRQWYESVPGVNQTFQLAVYLEPSGDNFSFESHDFFPLDGAGFGNQGQNHNFSFTFELHTRFRYAGGEVFRFSGDDDLWVFINGRLAIDLGGVHSAEDQNINLDGQANRLGIEPGGEYTLDFFQAERHATESNFQIDTTLEFTSCGTVLR
jgi:fibro-slime domain-containing protein